ncbi:MAG: nicotinate (nicotinamide) nucleotide adenylyltransferase [Verrucomicrobiota bacterium]
MKREKIALFGGSFDPVHRAHIAIAERAVDSCQLDRVIFIPSPQSPHKEKAPSATPEQRVEMLHLATENLPWAEVSTWEIDRAAKAKTPAYSWITVSHFSESHPDAVLYWILGSDQWNKIDTWSRPELLAKLLTFIVFPRGESPRNAPGFACETIDFSIDGSSTEARKVLASAGDTGELLPEKVREFIATHALYRPATH